MIGCINFYSDPAYKHEIQAHFEILLVLRLDKAGTLKQFVSFEGVRPMIIERIKTWHAIERISPWLEKK